MSKPNSTKTYFTEKLWPWSLDVYASPRTQEACLNLQNQFSLDVNTLLWLCWCADSYKTPTSKALDMSADISAYWQSEIIASVRKARKQLGSTLDHPSDQSLKKEFLQLEIMAEHRQQNQLEPLTTFSQDPEKWTKKGLCQNNLDLLLASLSQDAPLCARATETLCTAIF